MLRLLAAIVLLLPAAGLRSAFSEEVIAYVAQDQVYAEPIFRDFEQSSKIKVLPVYDSEAVKTVGLANRLIAERAHPRCDVFWGNEEMRTRQLATQGIFSATNNWTAFGHRSRRLVVNTRLVPADSRPRDLMDLTNSAWRGRVAVAYPQFGTTAAHFHALRQYWHDEAWEQWCRALAANKPMLVEGNSVVVRMVGQGRAAVGLTDSDDIAAGQNEHWPVAAVPLSPDMLLIPNTAGVVKGAPHPLAARKLFDYLQSPPVRQRLVEAKALESIQLQDDSVATIKPDWPRLIDSLKDTNTKLDRIFLE